MKAFFELWALGVVKPRRALPMFKNVPAPSWGFYATLIRFVGTALTSILALHLLDKRPFVSSYLIFLKEENYYLAEIFFLDDRGVVPHVEPAVIAELKRKGVDEGDPHLLRLCPVIDNLISSAVQTGT